MAENQELKKRNYIRFLPDPNTLLWLSQSASVDDSFEPCFVGLVLDESQKGCSAVFVKDQISEQLLPGNRCVLAVGDMPRMIAEIRWQKELDNKSVRLGFEYIL